MTLRRQVARLISIVLAVGASVGLAAPGRAHEEHRTTRREHMAHHPGGSAAASARPESLTGRAVPDTAALEPRFAMPPIMEALSHHLHNKLIHFPIVLSPLALLALFLSRRRPELLGLARALAWLAVFSAGAALWAGLAQAPDFKGEPKEWLVLVHRNWGIATMVAMLSAALLSLGKGTRRQAWLLALLAVAFVSIGAYLGGLVSHG